MKKIYQITILSNSGNGGHGMQSPSDYVVCRGFNDSKPYPAFEKKCDAQCFIDDFHGFDKKRLRIVEVQLFNLATKE